MGSLPICSSINLETVPLIIEYWYSYFRYHYIFWTANIQCKLQWTLSTEYLIVELSLLLSFNIPGKTKIFTCCCYCSKRVWRRNATPPSNPSHPPLSQLEWWGAVQQEQQHSTRYRGSSITGMTRSKKTSLIIEIPIILVLLFTE